MLKIKRVYERHNPEDGTRFLVERLWPRGIKKEKLRMQAWMKEAAPSPALRRWYAHDINKWEQFQERYRQELQDHPEAWHPLLEAARQGDVTLLYSASDTQHNSALVLKSWLEAQLKK
jgi:uncharacterized protein YeaO (DUF488 family)